MVAGILVLPVVLSHGSRVSAGSSDRPGETIISFLKRVIYGVAGLLMLLIFQVPFSLTRLSLEGTDLPPFLIVITIVPVADEPLSCTLLTVQSLTPPTTGKLSSRSALLKEVVNLCCVVRLWTWVESRLYASEALLVLIASQYACRVFVGVERLT